MTSTGTEYTTGEQAPVSGVYAYVRHLGAACYVTPAQREIPLARGERFPPLRQCNHAVVWRLVRLA